VKEEHVIEEINNSGEEANYIAKRLGEYNENVGAKSLRQTLGAIVRENEQIIGGMFGNIRWGWFHLDLAWIDEAKRHKGVGFKLLEYLERAARKKKLIGMRTETGSFQALPFYRKHGFEICAEFDIIGDDNKKFREYILRKRFQ